MEVAFDEALSLVARLLAVDIETVKGSSARPQLERLKLELSTERANALERGSVDREWLQKTVRSVVEWVPDDHLALVAALGRIARAAPSNPGKK